MSGCGWRRCGIEVVERRDIGGSQFAACTIAHFRELLVFDRFLSPAGCGLVGALLVEVLGDGVAPGLSAVQFAARKGSRGSATPLEARRLIHNLRHS